MPADDKNRERSPANLNIKYNPTLGASNAKRFQASVRTLLKTSAQNGELALAVLEGSADSSKESLVLFEPRAFDYDKVCQVLEETGDEAKALLAGKAETRAIKDVSADEHLDYMRTVLDIKRKLFGLLLIQGLYFESEQDELTGGGRGGGI